jgi:AraC-like DNA-binding protein
MNISALLIGISTAFFAIIAIYILFWHKERTRYQTVLGWIMTIWALTNLKDIILTFPGMYTPEILNWVMIIDGWGAMTYTIILFEVVMPRWTTPKRLALLSLPFALFTLLYIIWPVMEVIYSYAAFLWCFAWSIVIIGWIKVRRRISYVRENFSNIDRIDASWLKPVFFFAIVSQLTWLITSLIATVVTDIIYYASTLILWTMVLRYSWNFYPIPMEQFTEKSTDEKKSSVSVIEEGVLERVMEQQQLYMNKNLTLADLARELKTNRTYVSNYLSQVRGQTFYDYINQLRIERVSIPMLKEHPEYTLEYVSEKSGFASISTFRRAFIKLTGQTPRQFMTNIDINKPDSVLP